MEIRPSLTTSKEGLETHNIHKNNKDLTLDFGGKNNWFCHRIKVTKIIAVLGDLCSFDVGGI